MIIDLHTHSKLSIKNGDSIKLESNFEALKIFRNNHVKVAAFSDHNYFLAQEYLKVQKIAAQMGILFLPAVEVDVVRNNDRTGNIVIIFSDSLSFSQLLKLETIICKNTGKRKIRINRVASLFADFETIVVPHVGKTDFCSYEDLVDIDFDAIEVSNLAHHNYINFQSKLAASGRQTSIVAWSDTHVWSSYPQLKNLYTFIANIYSFADLKQALQQNKMYVRRR